MACAVTHYRVGVVKPLVLVCDNEEALRALVVATLDGPYAVIEAGDGGEALALARESAPDLIVLDMMMPVLSGLEVLHAVRDDPELRAIPVVMLTARAQAADREAALAAGAQRFMAKPFSPLALATAIDELLNEPAE
jgi:CheY-like chemotaxis protein